MIIGIIGTDGSGKGAVAQYLVENRGFTHYKARKLIVDKLLEHGLPTDRKNMRIMANKMRKEKGDDVIVTTYLEKARKANIKDIVVESIRTLVEAKALKEKGGILIAVDADQKLRYKRIYERASESDHVSFKEFKEQEELEMDDPDPHGMQKAKVMASADYTIINNGTLEELHLEIDKMLQKVAS